jgi:hypothetical protein
LIYQPNSFNPHHLFLFKKEKVLDIIAFPIFCQRKILEEKRRKDAFKGKKLSAKVENKG